MKPANVFNYGQLLTGLKQRIFTAQYAALKAVNKELIALYWDIGKMIAEKQEQQGWGKSVVERLSFDLKAEFGERSGFSVQNLWYMRQFYREYQDQKNLQPLVGEISWSKYLIIMSRCKDPLKREFYLRSTARFGWHHYLQKQEKDSCRVRTENLNPTHRCCHLQPDPAFAGQLSQVATKRR